MNQRNQSKSKIMIKIKKKEIKTETSLPVISSRSQVTMLPLHGQRATFNP